MRWSQFWRSVFLCTLPSEWERNPLEISAAALDVWRRFTKCRSRISHDSSRTSAHETLTFLCFTFFSSSYFSTFIPLFASTFEETRFPRLNSLTAWCRLPMYARRNLEKSLLLSRDDDHHHTHAAYFVLSRASFLINDFLWDFPDVYEVESFAPIIVRTIMKLKQARLQNLWTLLDKSF